MTNSEFAFASACREAENQVFNELFFEIDSEPSETLKGKEKRRMQSFLRELEKSSLFEKERVNVTHLNFSKALKVALVAVFILAMLIVAAVAIEPVRNFIINKYDTYSEVIFKTESDDDYLFASYDCHLEGYELDKAGKDRHSQYIWYLDNNGNRLCIETLRNGSSFGFDTEESIISNIQISGKEAFFISNPDFILLIWSSGQYTTSIYADINDNTDVTVEDLIKIAESRKKAGK